MSRRIVIHNHLPLKKTCDGIGYTAQEAKSYLDENYIGELTPGAKDRATRDMSDVQLIDRANQARFFPGPYADRLKDCINALKNNPGSEAMRQALWNCVTLAFTQQYAGDRNTVEGVRDATNYEKMGFTREALMGETIAYNQNQLSLLKGDLRSAKEDGHTGESTSIERSIALVESVIAAKREGLNALRK